MKALNNPVLVIPAKAGIQKNQKPGHQRSLV
jgi:hypothetical protein